MQAHKPAGSPGGTGGQFDKSADSKAALPPMPGHKATVAENTWTRAAMSAVDDSHIPYSASTDGDFDSGELTVYYPGYRKPGSVKLRQQGRRMTAISTKPDGSKTRAIVRSREDLAKAIDDSCPQEQLEKPMPQKHENEDEIARELARKIMGGDI